MDNNKNKLNYNYFVLICATCDNLDKCNLNIKNTYGSICCYEHRLIYGCKWFFIRFMWDEMDD
ncbi:MAG: hypothetical protein PHE29_13960 [Tissierellia bacterium]|nr:hypothetical protein [Tissierellia bacterium]MDD4779041.1 hypothetical protein [Tissierellia bacterium]